MIKKGKASLTSHPIVRSGCKYVLELGIPRYKRDFRLRTGANTLHKKNPRLKKNNYLKKISQNMNFDK